MAKLRTASDGLYQQLEEARTELENSRVETKVSKAQTDDLQSRLENAMADLEAQSKSEKEWMASFLKPQ